MDRLVITFYLIMIPNLLVWLNLLIMPFLPLNLYFLYRGQCSRYINDIEYNSIPILTQNNGKNNRRMNTSASGSDKTFLNNIKIRYIF